MGNNSNIQEGGLTFWDHLEVMRGCIWKMLIATALAAIVMFCLKEPLFDIILAPCHGSFIIYRWLGADDFELHLINTGLAEQMSVHIKMAISAGVIIILPYILYVAFSFFSPALYEKEKIYSKRITISAYLMFIVGAVVNYFSIFPLTVRFLGTYQISNDIDNMLTVSSYTETLLMMTTMFGILFELPVLSWLLAKAGMLKPSWMQAYRRHAFVAVLIIAAAITPTTDVFTLMVVSLPIWLLYETSIIIVKFTKDKKETSK